MDFQENTDPQKRNGFWYFIFYILPTPSLKNKINISNKNIRKN
jgi:hypothetical protein